MNDNPKTQSKAFERAFLWLIGHDRIEINGENVLPYREGWVLSDKRHDKRHWRHVARTSERHDSDTTLKGVACALFPSRSKQLNKRAEIGRGEKEW